MSGNICCCCGTNDGGTPPPPRGAFINRPPPPGSNRDGDDPITGGNWKTPPGGGCETLLFFLKFEVNPCVQFYYSIDHLPPSICCVLTRTTSRHEKKEEEEEEKRWASLNTHQVMTRQKTTRSRPLLVKIQSHPQNGKRERDGLLRTDKSIQKRKNRLWQLPSLVSSHAGIPCRPPLTGGIAASVRIVAFQPVLIGLEDSSQDVRRAAVLVQPMRAFDRPL